MTTEHHQHIRTDLRQGLFRFGPRLTVGEAAKVFARYVCEEAFDPDFPILCDLSAMREIEASFFRVAQLAPELAAFPRPVVAAALVPNTTVFGYARMLGQILGSASEIRSHPVRQPQEALAFVGLPRADFAALFSAQP